MLFYLLSRGLIAHRSLKCDCEAERSLSVERLHFSINASGVIMPSPSAADYRSKDGLRQSTLIAQQTHRRQAVDSAGALPMIGTLLRGVLKTFSQGLESGFPDTYIDNRGGMTARKK